MGGGGTENMVARYVGIWGGGRWDGEYGSPICGDLGWEEVGRRIW